MKKYLGPIISSIVIMAVPFSAKALDLNGYAGLFGLSDKRFSEILTAIIIWLLDLIAGLAIITFIVSGIMYITAGGDEDRIEKAKKIVFYGIIGLAVSLLGLVIVKTVDSIIGGNSNI